jgi:two-component system, NtrC family, response regulator GlrR
MFERDYLEEALRRSGGNIAEAARASGKARRAFFELMRKHGVRSVGAQSATASG